MQYSYSKEMCTGRAESIRIVGGPDNQPPDKWSTAVIITFDVQFTLGNDC